MRAKYQSPGARFLQEPFSRPSFFMSHDFCRAKLGEFLDQTLDENQRAEVTSHLESCAECAQIARETANIRDTLRGFTPVEAPAQLRQNVRNALQKERQEQQLSPARRPIFAWRLPQMAWSGSLAIATIALIVLARPFANAPLEISSPETAAPIAATPPHAPALAPKSEVAPRSTARVQKRAPARVPESENREKVLIPAPAQSKKLEQNRQTRTDSSRDNSAPPNAAKARPQARQSEVLRPQTTPRALAPNDDISSQSGARLEDSDAASQSATAAPAPPPLFSTRGATPKMARKRAAPSAEMPQNSKAQISDQKPRADENKVMRQSLSVSPEAAPEPSFSFELKAVPAPLFSPNPPAPKTGAMPRIAAPQMRANVTEPAPPVAPEMAVPPAAAGGRAGNAASRFARSGANNRAASPPPVSQFTAPPDAAITSDPMTATESGISGTARRFNLQIRAQQPLKNLQIRLEVPPALRLMWPASPIIWSGDFSPGTPLSVPFSLSQSRGGEKILVVVEQKIVGAPSRILETQTLRLPPVF